LLVFSVVLFMSLALAVTLETVMDDAVLRSGYRPLVTEWSFPVGVLIATAISLSWIDGVSWTYVGLGRPAARPRLLVQGFILGGLAIGVPSLLLLITGELRVVPEIRGSWLGGAGLTFASLLPAALGEELLLRGYIFAVLREAIGWRWTLITTSIAFGLLHVSNPGADAESVVLVMLAGFFLGSVLLATGSLYAAVMVHFGWNWVMAALLHTPVSGIAIIAPDYRVVDAGPDWLTGGTWGPEGGLAAALSMFAVVIYLYARYLRRMEL
jgi:uncharacterized protein